MHNYIPLVIEQIEVATHSIGFSMGSDRACGSLLRTLATSKPGGFFLELGTGTGLSTAWILDGMDDKAKLVSVDADEEAVAIARQYLGKDGRLDLQVGDANDLLDEIEANSCDFVFSDTWVGKFERLEETLALLKKGGLYIIDDLLPQPNWPDGHSEKVVDLRESLRNKNELTLTWMSWSTGLIVAVKK